MEIFLTISGGILVFVMGQALVEAFLKPILEQREVLGEIISETIFSLSTNTVNIQRIKDLSSKITAKTNKLLFYKFFSMFRIVYSLNKIEQLESCLLGLSDDSTTDDNEKYLLEMKEVLNIKR